MILLLLLLLIIFLLLFLLLILLFALQPALAHASLALVDRQVAVGHAQDDDGHGRAVAVLSPRGDALLPASVRVLKLYELVSNAGIPLAVVLLAGLVHGQGGV